MSSKLFLPGGPLVGFLENVNLAVFIFVSILGHVDVHGGVHGKYVSPKKFTRGSTQACDR